MQVCIDYRPGPITCGVNCIYTSTTLSLSCNTQDKALWSTVDFGEGLDDQTRISGVSLGSRSMRVRTGDDLLRPFSDIWIYNLSYDDHGATVTCEDSHPTGRQSAKISAGKF